MLSNVLLRTVDLKPTDRFVVVQENELGDSNFVLTNLLGQVLSDESNRVCFVIMHNTLGHYVNIGRRLNYDLLKQTQAGQVQLVDLMKLLVQSLSSDDSSFFTNNKEDILKNIFLEIHKALGRFLEENPKRAYLIIDDISHFLDLGIELKYLLSFINSCTQLTSRNVSVIVNCHAGSDKDVIVANALRHCSDLHINVSPLKTGINHNVTGVIQIDRRNNNEAADVYHYKAYDREIQVFKPGDILNRLQL